jgi:hypothetical protein
MTRPKAKLIWHEGYWRHRSEEARAISEEIRNPDCRRIMREIAESYEYLARLTKSFQKAAMAPQQTRDEVAQKH